MEKSPTLYFVTTSLLINAVTNAYCRDGDGKNYRPWPIKTENKSLTLTPSN